MPGHKSSQCARADTCQQHTCMHKSQKIRRTRERTWTQTRPVCTRGHAPATRMHAHTCGNISRTRKRTWTQAWPGCVRAAAQEALQALPPLPLPPPPPPPLPLPLFHLHHPWSRWRMRRRRRQRRMTDRASWAGVGVGCWHGLTAAPHGPENARRRYGFNLRQLSVKASGRECRAGVPAGKACGTPLMNRCGPTATPHGRGCVRRPLLSHVLMPTSFPMHFLMPTFPMHALSVALSDTPPFRCMHFLMPSSLPL